MKRVLGYSNPWSVAPGETVDLHVSLLDGSDYRLDVVRVVSGDAEHLGLDLRPMPSALDGVHLGWPCRTLIGSCLVVDPAPQPDPAAPFAVELWLWPTLPGRGRQGLLGCCDAASGWSLEIGAAGDIVFRIAGEELASGTALAPRRWTWTRAEFNPIDGAMTLIQRTLGDVVLGPERERRHRRATGLRRLATAVSPLLIAALPDENGVPTAHYNGKLARPRLLSGERLIAAWEFGPNYADPQIADWVGGHHGRLINLPARAVTGPDWTGDIHDWRAAPDQYDAIHFHEDDLYDARWPVSHRLTVPDDWSSGYYAVRVAAGDDVSYLPLFVRPPRDRSTAPLAVLASTLTTLAYANYHFHLHVDMNEASLGRVAVLSPEDVLLCEDATLGLATYDSHLDGSPVRYGSRLRPVVNNWPGGEVWNLNADTHLLAWLDHIGQPYDLVTDEDVHAEGSALLGRYRAVIAGSHPEYWTTPMWDGLAEYLAASGRLMYLGGNGFYWRAALSPAWPGAIEVRHAEGGGRYTAETPGHYHMSFTGELGGLWRRSGRPPHALVGVGTRGIGFDGVGCFRRTAASRNPRAAWLFEGVSGETFGDRGLVGCAAGSEIDATDAALGTPPHALTVAASEGHTSAMQPMPEDITMPHPAMAASQNPAVRADMTFFETASGGAVFSASSLSWVGAVADTGFANDAARITTNVLTRFLNPQPFAFPDH